MKKQFLGVAFLILMYSVAYGQFEIHPDSSIYTMSDSVEYYYQNDTSEGGSLNQMRRDMMIWVPRLAPHGKMSIATQAMNKYAKDYSPPNISTASILNTTTASTTTWRELGPNNNLGTSGGNGIGQIHRIAFHPDYGLTLSGQLNQTMYAGSHWGGLFRSDNGGQDWFNFHTDLGLPITSVSGIAVSRQNVFVCTGTGDFGWTLGYNSNYSSLGPGPINNNNPIHTEGVYRFNDVGGWRSINGSAVLMSGGNTLAGLNAVFADGGTMRNIVAAPKDDRILFIATSLGIFRTLDMGVNWQQVVIGPNSTTLDPEWRGLAFHPNYGFPDPITGVLNETIYASGRDIYRSTDNGLNWVVIGSNSQFAVAPFSISNTARINIAVTPADPNALYASLVKNGQLVIVLCSNATTLTPPTWAKLAGHAGTFGEAIQPGWASVAVSPTNPDKVYFCHTKVRGNADLGLGFIAQSGYAQSGFHADVHEVVFPPHSDGFLFAATHGGVSVKETAIDNTGGWTELYNGLGVANLWSFDDWEGDPDRIAGAYQCNGSKYTTNRGDSWTQALGGDGYGARIDDQSGLIWFKGNGYTDFVRKKIGVPNSSETNYLPLVYNWSACCDLAQGTAGSCAPCGEKIHNAFPMINNPKTDELYIGANDLQKRLILEPTSSATPTDVLGISI